MTWWEFFIIALATWRLTSMLVDESGPWHIFTKMRTLTGIQHDPEERPFQIPDRFFANLLSCVWCASMWVGAFWLILLLIFPTATVYIASYFALSALAILLDKLISK